jgi:adenine-specific DNA-methyltransferase
MPEDTQLPLASADPSADLLAQLRAAAPLVFSEGKVDFDKLKAALGEQIDSNPERYGLSWAGKSDAFRNVQAPSVGTLLPMPEDSVNWDSTENLIIEGDNLEVLKLLQKPYHGKVKMIYIDPPYNTGNEFIYPDNFREGLDDYLRYSGQVSEEGIKQSTNTETSGRFHSKWLSMMYPRLFLARNLLRDDGVIFVSINDIEGYNLRSLMNEVFGEEAFVGMLTWKARVKPVNIGDAKYRPQNETEYVLVYERISGKCKFSPLVTGGLRSYPHQIHGRKYRLTTILKSNRGINYRSTMSFELDGYSPPDGQRWQAGEDVIKHLHREGYIEFRDGTPFRRYFEDEEGAEHDPFYCFVETARSSTSEAGKGELHEILGTKDHGFDTVKPTRLIKTLLMSSTLSKDGDIVLDFFAGTGTTGNAVIDLNHEDAGNRKFILVQLPEKTEEQQFPSIAHLTRERIQRAIIKFNEEGDGKSGHGFRAFKLSSSNFKIWNAEKTPDDPEKLAEQLKLYADNVERSRDEQDILYELILKSGLPLSSKVEQISIEGKSTWSVNDNKLLIYLNKSVTHSLLHEMLARKPEQLLCLDAAFAGDDALKTNVVLEAKSHGVVFHTV